MGKQIRFYAEKKCGETIKNIMDNFFDDLVVIPFYKEKAFQDNEETRSRIITLTEKKLENEIVYVKSVSYDEFAPEVVHSFASPTFNYVPSFRNLENEIVEGEFECLTSNEEFMKKFLKFIAQFKKEFIYVRKYRTYLSPNIDLSTAKFQGGVVITEADLPQKKSK